MRSVLLFSFLAFCFVGYAQVIDFPDANFKNALVNTLCVDIGGSFGPDIDADLNDDGEIDLSEALNIEKLNVSSNQIINLAGIENFSNLINLTCNDNKITSLELIGFLNLKSLNCDGNILTKLNLKELNKLEWLSCSANQLSTLEIGHLKSLVYLVCYGNNLSSIDLKGLNNLSTLDCGGNQLTNIDISELLKLVTFRCSKNKITNFNKIILPNLFYLSIDNNNLTTLNVEGFKNLKSLSCENNQLSYLEFDSLKYLKFLNCYNNLLTSLNVNDLSIEQLKCQNNKLITLNVQITTLGLLDCSNNFLTTLNLKQSKSLNTLYCYNNLLTTLFLPNISLEKIFCSNNQLVTLDLQNMRNLEYVDADVNKLTYILLKGTAYKYPLQILLSNNSTLRYFCCNEEDKINIKETIENYGYSNCEVNSYCTFTPGGKFYILSGENKYDENNDGCLNQDLKMFNLKYEITDGNISGTIISNSNGNYVIPVHEGTHTITPILDHPNHFDITPSSFTITFPSTSDTITQDFCITPKGIFRQTNITVIPLTPPARPGFEAKYKIVWENAGNQIENGTLNFTYDETLLDYISATQTADQVADGIVKWNFTNLLPFEKREITVTLKVNRPTDTPAVNAGDKLYLTASILDNIFTLENTVVGSYDPNDKTCLQGDRVKPDMVGEYVDYLIRFENTGNYAAENVVVKDIIDTKTFDVSTLKITDASHEVYTRIEGNKVEFIFENIQLPFDDANNDGYIAFKIKTLPTLVLGDSLKNLADIYFDYNFPIRTNEAQTTVAFPVFTKDITTEVKFYPNPVFDILYLDKNDHWTKAEIFDIAGRIMRSISLDSSSMDVSGLESGTYFIRLKDGEKVGLVKFVKM
jgi:uncharacterized repeat protein (TIGR01451 family)